MNLREKQTPPRSGTRRGENVGFSAVFNYHNDRGKQRDFKRDLLGDDPPLDRRGSMMKATLALARAGVSVIPVRKNDKAPTQSNWSELKTLTPEQVSEQAPKWHNYGIRPGAHSQLANGDNLITIDLDIKDASVEKEALAKLHELIPEIDEFAVVYSGNKLGLSRHYVGSTNKPLRSRRLWAHPEKVTWTDGKKKDKAQIDIIGTGKQHVGPGSMHPDGYEYELANAEDFDAMIDDWTNGTRSHYISSSAFDIDDREDGPRPRKKIESIDDIVDHGPVEMSDDEVTDVLKNLPLERIDDYQSWLEIGMALDHQFPDDPDYALELWHWVSKKSDKYDADVLEDKWETIKDDKGTASITFRTLIKEAHEAQHRKSTTATVQTIRAVPYNWPKPHSVPRREWLYGRHHLRSTVSATIAPGGMGKSSLGVVEALAMVTGLELLGEPLPEGALNVWYLNLEEPIDELHRRFAAAKIHNNIRRADFRGLLCVSGNELELKIAEESKLGFHLNQEVIEELKSEIRRRNIDVLIIDPFVSSHRVGENDNTKIDAVVKALGRVAYEARCAVDVVHHVRKGNGEDFTAEDSRGASSMVNGVRGLRVLNRMTVSTAKKCGVDDHRRYFRIDNGKANYAPPVNKATWCHLQSVGIGNGDDALGLNEDRVGVVERWHPPTSQTEFATSDLDKAVESVADGNWRKDLQSPDWVGIPIAHALGWNRDDPGTRDALKRLIAQLLDDGALSVELRQDARRKPREYVVVNSTNKRIKRDLI